jgi:hypothetical protein
VWVVVFTCSHILVPNPGTSEPLRDVNVQEGGVYFQVNKLCEKSFGRRNTQASDAIPDCIRSFRFSSVVLSCVLLISRRRQTRRHRPKRPRALKFVASSNPRQLESWVRIPLEASVFLFCVCVVLCREKPSGGPVIYQVVVQGVYKYESRRLWTACLSCRATSGSSDVKDTFQCFLVKRSINTYTAYNVLFLSLTLY